MFKNGIILKKSSWHRRLINWIYENDTEYKNFCPYFWLLLGTILLFPMLLIFKTYSLIMGLKDNENKNNTNQLIIKIILFGEFIFKIIKIIFNISISYFITFAVCVFLILTVNIIIDHGFVSVFLRTPLSLIIGLSIFALIIYIISSKRLYYKYENKSKYKSIIVGIPYKTIEKPLEKIYRKTKNKIKEFYKNNCPLIIWK